MNRCRNLRLTNQPAGSVQWVVFMAVGTLLASVPATAASISFTTTANPSVFGISNGPEFAYQGSSVGPIVDTGGGTFLDQNPDSFGVVQFMGLQGGTVPSVIDLQVTPTVDGIAGSPLDFKGSATHTLFGSTTGTVLDFSSTPGSSTITLKDPNTGVTSSYTKLTENGVVYAIENEQQLSTATFGKTTAVQGFIQAVPPPPATPPTAIVSFSTTANPLVFGLADVRELTYQDAAVGPLTVDGTGTFLDQDLTNDSFGLAETGDSFLLTDTGRLDFFLTPTLNGVAGSPLDFVGSVAETLVGNSSELLVSFAGTPGSTSVALTDNGVTTTYVELNENGVNYAVQAQNLVPAFAGVGHTYGFQGFVQTTTALITTTPEPASGRMMLVMSLGLAVVLRCRRRTDRRRLSTR